MIRLVDLHLRAGSFSLGPLNLDFPARTRCVIEGPNGCGKSTLLETIAGMTSAESGTILLGDVNITQVDPAARTIGLVPQDVLLFPRLTVAGNIALPLVVRGSPRSAACAESAALMQSLHLSPLADRWPANLSGGERQRVALARAIAAKPSALLIDEGMSAAAPASRVMIQQVIDDYVTRSGATLIHVSHAASDGHSAWPPSALPTLRFRLDSR